MSPKNYQALQATTIRRLHIAVTGAKRSEGPVSAQDSVRRGSAIQVLASAANRRKVGIAVKHALRTLPIFNLASPPRFVFGGFLETCPDCKRFRKAKENEWQNAIQAIEEFKETQDEYGPDTQT
jgi:hypothetical protein